MLDSIRTKARSFGVMVIFGIIIVVFVFWGMGNYGGNTSRTLATVNGEAITVEDFSKVFSPTVEARKKTEPDILDNPDKVKQVKREVLAELIKSRMTLREARRLGMHITPQELRLALDTFSVFHDDSGKFNKDIYLQVLAAQGLEPGFFEEEYSRELLERKLIRYVGLSANVNEGEAKNLYTFSLEKRKAEYVLFNPDDYLDKAVVSDDEIAKDYDEKKESFRTAELVSLDYIRLTPDQLSKGYEVSDAEAEEYYKQNSESFRKPERVQVRHIFISYPVEREGGAALTQEEKKIGARELMDNALAELKKGKEFAEVAKQFSHDQESAQNGGLLNWIARGDIPLKEFEDAAFALKKGDTSEVVSSEAGLHLIKLEGKEEGGLPAFADVKQDIVQKLATQKADADFHNVQKAAEDALALNLPLEDLASKFNVAVDKTGLVPEKEAEKQLALSNDSKQFLLDAIAAAAVGSIKESASSANATAPAVPPSSASGMTIPVPLNVENGIALVRVGKVQPSIIPPLEEVRAQITERLKAEKARKLAKEDAEKALPSFSGQTVPDAYKSKAQISQEAARAFPVIEPLGSSEALLQGLFSSNGEWLPMVYDTDKGPVIARTASVEPVSDEDWQRWKGIFMPQMQEAKKNEAVTAFMRGVDERAEVKLYLDLLDNLTFSNRR